MMSGQDFLRLIIPSVTDHYFMGFLCLPTSYTNWFYIKKRLFFSNVHVYSMKASNLFCMKGLTNPKVDIKFQPSKHSCYASE